jgi:hypothetical protein
LLKLAQAWVGELGLRFHVLRLLLIMGSIPLATINGLRRSAAKYAEENKSSVSSRCLLVVLAS